MNEETKYCADCDYFTGEECGSGPCEGSEKYNSSEACANFEEKSEEM